MKLLVNQKYMSFTFCALVIMDFKPPKEFIFGWVDGSLMKETECIKT